MKKRNLIITVILLIIITVSIGVKSAIILKTIFSTLPSAALTGMDKSILIIGILAIVIINIIFAVIIISISTKDKKVNANINNEENKVRATNKAVQTSTKESKQPKQSKQEAHKERQKYRNDALKKLNSDIARFSNIPEFTEKILSNIANEYDVMQAIFFVKDPKDNVFKKQAAYAFYSEDDLKEFSENMGLSGQVAASKKPLNITNIPDKYITVLSGLGESSPTNLLILPIVYKGESIGIVELASFKGFDNSTEEILMNFLAQTSEKLFNMNNNQES